MRWIVYETRCLVSGKIYVGVHRQDDDGFDGYLGSGKALRRAIKKHGVENFVRRTLEEFSVEAEAYAREAEIVTEEFCKRRDTYNVKPGGFGGGCIGHRHTPESRAKIGEKMRGNTNFLGHRHTPESREKIRKAGLGNKRCVGRTHSPKTREKIRKASLGKKHSPESREKMRGRTHSPEHREKIRAANLGKTHTPATREKMRESQLRRWANHRNNAA